MNKVFDKFPRFCEALRINSKEFGLVPLRMWGSQKHLMREIGKGLEDGIHYFVVLKGRQLGCSTVTLALNPYWMFLHPGVQGSLITDTESNRDYFRSILTDYIDSLPRYMRVPVIVHNRNELQFKNLSRLIYLVAGTRKKREGGELGRAKGINFVHATECSSWADEDGLSSFTASLAENYPNRLYVFESTARGFNIFYDMWETAKKAKSQKAIFIGWWMSEMYQVHRDTAVFRTYWDGKLSHEERLWVRQVKESYGHEITPEQMAWWRWKLNEVIGDLNMMYQEFPPTEEYAFVMSGYKFFNSEKLTKEYKAALREHPETLRYTFGTDFVDTCVKPTTRVNAELLIWERPKPNGVYVIGADPAYGFNVQSDQSVASVFRCYADRMVQVAEFCARGVLTSQFAWVLLHLAGAYRNTRVNLELTGPGTAVLNELNNVKKNMSLLPRGHDENVLDALDGMKYYLYSREDSLTKSFAFHSKTGSDQKERMLNQMKDKWQTDRLVIRSAECLQEMKYFARDGAQLEGRGGENDDRVIGVALAVLAWLDWCQIPLATANQTYEVVCKDEQDEKTPTNALIVNFLQQRGIVRKDS